jgi:hypothetical protein
MAVMPISTCSANQTPMYFCRLSFAALNIHEGVGHKPYKRTCLSIGGANSVARCKFRRGAGSACDRWGQLA